LIVVGATSVQSAWTAYQQAVRDLYTAPPEDVPGRTRGGAGISSEKSEQRIEVVLQQSKHLGAALAESMTTDNLDQRELAGWKLVAAAAYDLSVAGDLLEGEAAGRQAAPTRRASSAFAAAPELREVLEAPMDTNLRALTKPATRAVLPMDSKAARERLGKTIATFLEAIPEAAAGMSQMAVSGVVTVGLAPARQSVSVLVQELLARLPDVASPITRHALQIVAEALSKLQAAMGGEEVQPQVEEEVSAWLKDIQEKRDTVTSLLDRLYEMERIGEATRALLPEDPETLPAERYNQATTTLEELLARYSKTRQVLEGVMRVLAYVQKALLPSVPWGPLGVYGTYLGVLGYAVFSGGDYLDWYRLGERDWLDRVDGLRTTVGQVVHGDT
jgi:hypothetical protein